MIAEQLEAWIDETEECGDGFSSEVNTKEVDDTDNKETKLMAEELDAWIDETEECGDGFSSEVNTKEVDGTDNKENMGENEEISIKVEEIQMRTPKGMQTHVFYKKGSTEEEKEEVIAMARNIATSKGCVVKTYGNNVEFSPFMYNSPSSSPMMVKKLIPKPPPYS